MPIMEKINTTTYALDYVSPKDHLTVEVGDSKQPIFYPQVKLMRWDNEVNFSARLLDTQPQLGKAAETPHGVKWAKGNTEINFYDITPCRLYPEGGYEMEITLKEKPLSNVVTFSIQTKNLDFFYQPELTEEEKIQLAKRPEHVVGSYAVYYRNTPNNYSDSKGYKAGKAFHIYRPRIQDAVGNKVWGILNVDVPLGLMTVTIPQEFLDNAVYPITHVGGATFGYTTAGASSRAASESTNKCFGAVFSGSAGTASKVTCYYRENNLNAGYTDMGVFLHSDLTKLTNADSNSVAFTKNQSAGWVDHAFATSPTTSAVDYVLALTPRIGKGNGSVYIYYDSGSANQGHNITNNSWENSNTTYSWSTLTVGSHDTNKYSMYVTYTASGGSTAIQDIVSSGFIAFPR